MNLHLTDGDIKMQKISGLAKVTPSLNTVTRGSQILGLFSLLGSGSWLWWDFSLRDRHIGKYVQDSERKALPSSLKNAPRHQTQGLWHDLYPDQNKGQRFNTSWGFLKNIKKQKIIIPFPAKHGSAKTSQAHLSWKPMICFSRGRWKRQEQTMVLKHWLTFEYSWLFWCKWIFQIELFL